MKQALAGHRKSPLENEAEMDPSSLIYHDSSINSEFNWALLDAIRDMVLTVTPEFKIFRTNRSMSHWLIQNGYQSNITGIDCTVIMRKFSDEMKSDYLQKLSKGKTIFLEESTLQLNGSSNVVSHFIPFLKKNMINEIAIIFKRLEPQTVTKPYIDIAKSSHDRAIIIHDFDGQIMAWDQGAEKIYGYSEDKALQMNITEITTPEDLNAYQHIMNNLYNGATVQTFEIQRRAKSGDKVYVWVNTKLIKDENNQPYAIALTDYNISEIKRARKALRDSEDKYNTLTENIRVGIYRTLPDDDGRFIEINPAALKMFGIKNRTEAMKTRISDLYHNPKDRQLFKKKIEQNGHIDREEFLLERTDGTQFWCSISAVAHKDQNGNIKYYDGILEDITDRIVYQKKIKRSEKRYRDLIDNLSEGIIVLDSKFNIRLANSAAENILLGEPGNLTKHNFVEFIDDENLRNLKKYVRNHKKSREQNCDLDILIPNGISRTISVSCSPHYAEDSKRKEILAVIRDVTNIRKMEEDIIKATKLESISILAGGIAHDFNNILTIILGNLSLAKMFLSNDENILKRIEKAEVAANRAKDLTQQLLSFSKGGSPVKKISSIKELIEESVNFSLTGSKIKCELSIPDDTWALEIDEGQISQSINNLIINAMQAMPDGGHIFFSVRNLTLKKGNHLRLKAGQYLKITIEDEGSGIPPKFLKKIFDPYFTTKEKGNGLGLSSVYSIVSKHDGTITVNSTAGIGTKFDIYLPANSKLKYTGSQQSENLIQGEGRVLVMDDEEEILEVAQIILKNLGYKVDTAKNGKKALELYKSALDKDQKYDAIILDLTIRGGMGGKVAVKKILEWDPDANAIVSSGYSNDPILANFTEHGFKDVIKKPFKAKDLCKILKMIIDQP
jgi:two-component system cell cycle sensor histidine kinase/response regulator CckA